MRPSGYFICLHLALGAISVWDPWVTAKHAQSTSRLLKLVLHIQEKLSISFLFKHDIYKVIAHFPTTINLLFRNFSKQASIAVACKTSTKIIPPIHIFRLFATSNLLGYISELRRQSVWERCHNHCFGNISWCNSHTTKFVRLISLSLVFSQRKWFQHFCYFANGLNW